MNLRSLIPIGRDRNVARSDNPFISLQREIDRLFDDFTRGFPRFPPAAPPTCCRT
jgi:HSP20 family protein